MRRTSENQLRLSVSLVAAARCCCPDFRQLLCHAEENLESLTQGTYWILPKAQNGNGADSFFVFSFSRMLGGDPSLF